jgi:hypothetical protein
MDSLLEVWTEARIGEDVDFALQQRFQVLAEFDEIEQAASVVHFDEEVDIAVIVSFSPRHGPEDPHVVGSVRLCEAQYFWPFEFEQVRDTHSAFPKKSLVLEGYRFAHGLTSGTRQVLVLEVRTWPVCLDHLAGLVYGAEGATGGTRGWFIWFVWSIWFVLFIEPEKPNRPKKPDEQDRLVAALCKFSVQ